MDFPSTASGTHIPTSKPLLLMPDQDHPNTMNQIVWSLMYILQQKSLAGIAFDPDVTDTYTRLYQAIAGMISDSALSFADLVESRAGSLTDKVMNPAGVAAASGNFSNYIPVSVTPYDVVNTNMGGLHIASASASAIALPLLSTVPRVGAAYHFVNLTNASISVTRSGANVILDFGGSVNIVSLLPGQSAVFVKISDDSWAVFYHGRVATESLHGISLKTTYFHIQDRKPSGTQSGTFSALAWRTRALNTVCYNDITGALLGEDIGAGLAANQFKLPAGRYEVSIIAAAVDVGNHQAKLYNVTDATDQLIGLSCNNTQSSSDPVCTNAVISGFFVLAAPKVFELRHYCSEGTGTYGFGEMCNFGVDEIYADVKIKRFGQ